MAAAMLGWENAFHCEINPFGRSVLEYWFPNSVSYEDITKTSFKEWRGRIDVLTGGFPCQPFSYAGKRGGREDERYLWPEMLRAIDEIRPTWVVGENVAGLATMVEGWALTELGCSSSLFQEGKPVHDYLLEQTYTIEKIAEGLEGLGYSVQPVLIPAAAVGAPHRRDRIFILAHLEDSVQLGREGRDEVLEYNQRQGNAGAAGGGRETNRSSADPDGRRSGEIPAPVHTGVADGNEPIRARLSAALQSGLYGPQEWDDARRPAVQPADDAWIKGTWWDNFPTVSPVHAGNDGLPIGMDGIAIPFNKWRTEALKAYGNAIVPQVMYRIFQAIEKL